MGKHKSTKSRTVKPVNSSSRLKAAPGETSVVGKKIDSNDLDVKMKSPSTELEHVGSHRSSVVMDRAPVANIHPQIVRNKSKVLVLTTRGITTRFRHFLDDLLRLLPHAKKEPKLDSKDRLDVANEIADLRGCSNILILEARKRQDLYLWLAHAPFGPTVKFHVSNVHNMDELGFPGNNLMFSRPILTFDPEFDTTPHLRLTKELLTQTFAAPNGHRRTKPFVDHILAFFLCDGRIWIRHYQIVDAALDDKAQNKDVESTLVEIGPRLVMTPVKCFSSSFAGATLWENSSYISPNQVRRAIRSKEASKLRGKTAQIVKRRHHVAKHRIGPDPLADVFRS